MHVTIVIEKHDDDDLKVMASKDFGITDESIQADTVAAVDNMLANEIVELFHKVMDA